MFDSSYILVKVTGIVNIKLGFMGWLFVYIERSYGRFKEIQSNLRRKKLHKTNQCSNFLGRSFSNRDNVSVPIQFRGEHQHLKIFSLKNIAIHSHINSTSAITPIKQNQLSFSSIKINKLLTAPAHSAS